LHDRRKGALFIQRRSVALLLGALTMFSAALAPSFTENAVANGETRTIYLYHTHTREQIAATYLVNGRYDESVLERLNWFLRDWRRDEPTKMDPRLFDVVWEAYRQAGATQPINVVSAYRSPETNAMLRARSRAVAKHSQHMLGKAMDTTMPGMSMSQIREIAMRMQRGGVGYYPTAGTPFVHLDVGSVRSWPRMSYEQLARLFPDGKTVHLPTSNQPLARYEEAKAEIEARGGAYAPVQPKSKSFLAFLFGGGDEEEDAEVAPPPTPRKQWASLAPRQAARVAADGEEEGVSAPSEKPGRGGRRADRLAEAERNLPRGETTLRAGPPEPQRPAAETRAASRAVPVALAALEPAAGAGVIASIDSPLPPRRPHLLAFDAPLPPLRPVELAAAAPAPRPGGAGGAIASLIEAVPTRPATIGEAALRSTTTPEAAGSAPEPLLAYAPAAVDHVVEKSLVASEPPPAAAAEAKPPARRIAGLRPAFAPARLDRSNFQAMTATRPTSRMAPSTTTLGATLSAPRSAARAEQGLYAAAPQGDRPIGFQAKVELLPTDRFVAARP
jgi:uncharacterized protein YcbK (DUF882 family)